MSDTNDICGRPSVRTLLIVLLICGMMDGAASAQSYVRFSLTDLGTLGGDHSYPSALNNSGQVVGWSQGADGIEHGFCWHNGAMNELDEIGCHSEPHAISDSGVVVGGVSLPIGDCDGPWLLGVGVQWANGRATLLPAVIPGYNAGLATGVNDAGQIVGTSITCFEYGLPSGGPTLWNSNIPFSLLAPCGAAMFPTDINDAGQIVGNWMSDGLKAILWNPPVGSPPTNLLVFGLDYGAAINDNGWVVGRTGGNHAAVWLGAGQAVDLGTLAGANESIAHDINGAGVVVGDSGGRACRWKDSEVLDLNCSVAPGSGLTLFTASGINDDGWIICGASDSLNPLRAVLLVPVAKPYPSPDLNCDGTVDVSDFLILLGNWGVNAIGDLDEDGNVGILDFLMLLASWT